MKSDQHKKNNTASAEVIEKVIRKNALMKLVVMGVFIAAIIAFQSIAWFTMNREVSGNGMEMKSSDTPFELKTSGNTGLYDDYFQFFDKEYKSETETSGTNRKMIWQLSSQSHMDNYWTGTGTPTKDDLDRIKSIESSDYGLSPGDYGQIKFTIVPKDDSDMFSVRIYPETTCFRVGYYTIDNAEQGQIAGYQDNTFIKMEYSQENDKEALELISGHLLYFYEADTDGNGEKEMQLIGKDGFLIENITEEKDVVIHWVWPESLANIIEEDVDGLDVTGAYSLKHYFFEHPDLFLKKDENDDFTDITINADATAEEVEDKSAIITADRLSYATYRTMYNEADQIIGTNIGYIFLEMSVDVER